jgi:cell shape-determining protein MreC
MRSKTNSTEEVRELLGRLDEEAFYAYDAIYQRIQRENALLYDELAFYEDLLQQLQTFRKRLARLEEQEATVDAFLELEDELSTE